MILILGILVNFARIFLLRGDASNKTFILPTNTTLAPQKKKGTGRLVFEEWMKPADALIYLPIYIFN